MNRSFLLKLAALLTTAWFGCGDGSAGGPAENGGGTGGTPLAGSGGWGGASGAGQGGAVVAGAGAAAGSSGSQATSGTSGASGVGGSGGTEGELTDGGAIGPDGGTAGFGATGGAAGGSGATGGVGGAAGDGGSSGSSADCTPPLPGSTGTNPLFTDVFTADPAPLVFDCTFYIACGHDEGTTGFNLNEWYLLWSRDMVNWERQVAFGFDLFSWADANAWASQMVEKDGAFYWYVPVQRRSDRTMTIGVARASSPLGPFVDAIGAPLVDDDIEIANMGFTTAGDTPFTIDPTVFVDDDGRVYMHYGSFFRLVNAELNQDMISIKGTMVESTPQGFFEAPFLTKRNGIYYEVYARDGNPAKIDYATSNSPLGPWQYGGRILDPLPNNPGEDAATSHPGIAEFHGQWYLVYHLSHGTAGTYRRQVAIEKLTFNADGSIQKVTPSSGLQF